MPRKRKKKCPWPEEIAGYKVNDCDGKYYYDEDAANAPIRFAKDCFVHIKGVLARQPFVFENWMVPTTQTLFGWKRHSDNYRRFRRAYIQLARKQSKTTWLACIAGYMLYADGEPGAECYVAAKDSDQARFLYDLVKMNVEKNSVLSDVSKVYHSTHRIVYQDSFLRALPADEAGIYGANPHFIACDELFAWARGDMYHALATGMGARKQGMLVAISTAGFDRHTICYHQYKYACRVRDGISKDEQYLPVIFEVPEEDDWRDPKVWHKSNPMLGLSVDMDFLSQEYEYATENPYFEGQFRRLYCNQWTETETAFLPMYHYRRCETTPDPIPPGSEVFGGLDLSATKDLTSFCLLHQREDRSFVARWKYWLPMHNIEMRERADKVPYRQWVDEGWITPVPGTRVDYDMVRDDIIKWLEEYEVQIVGYDSWSALGLQQALEGEGFETAAVPMGYSSMNEPMLRLEKMVADEMLDHGGNPVSEWCAECLAAKSQDERVRPVKPNYADENKRIDGMVALLIAIHPFLRLEIEEPSIYETRGPIVIDL